MPRRADELHNLIEDLITFSRIGAGGVTIRPHAVELRQLTAKVISRLEGRGRDVSKEVPPGVSVLADPVQIVGKATVVAECVSAPGCRSGVAGWEDLLVSH